MTRGQRAVATTLATVCVLMMAGCQYCAPDSILDPVLEVLLLEPPQQQQQQQTQPKVDPKLQADRKAVIEKMIARGIFTKVEPGVSVPKCWAGSQFYAATFEEKSSFVGVVYAYYFPDGGSLGDLVQVKDTMTGKPIATFTRVGGLEMK